MPGSRRRMRYPDRLNVPAGPVTVRVVTPTRNGWSLADAVGLVRQGYTLEHASRVSGWPPKVISSRLRKDPHPREQ